MTTDVRPVAGLRLAAGAAGIRYQNRDDLVLVEIAPGSHTALVQTSNAFCAAPVQVAREHLRGAAPRYLLINAGNANAGTGAQGLRAARTTCEMLAARASCEAREVLPFSTGVIGEDLPLEPFARALPPLLEQLAEDQWSRAATAIMTTDTSPKLCSRLLETAQGEITLTGMAKGSGMIRPDMATMLAYIGTDASVSRELLQAALEQAVAGSFNAITVDGDTSTNDACALVATGRSDVVIDSLDDGIGGQWLCALCELCEELARAIVRDGEGATKLVRVQVTQAQSVDEARQVAYTVAQSPLVKTALFAEDPNWGRILAAIGRSGLADFDIDRVVVRLDEVEIVRDGGRAPRYVEEAGHAVLKRPEYEIAIQLGRGDAQARVLTCDLSYDYVRINAEYRS